jgi:tRNA (guanosine-2'-O-)-methyltransferase
MVGEEWRPGLATIAGIGNNVDHIRRAERRRRITEMYRGAAEKAQREATDPGLRDKFESLERVPFRIISSPQGKAVNHGGMLRIADAYRLERVDIEAEPDETMDISGAVGAFKWQPHRWVSAVEAVKDAKESGYTTFALDLNENAVALDQVEWRFPCALVLGSERYGVPTDAWPHIEQSVAIPMFGLVESLNVTHACVLAVDAAVRAYRQQNPDFEPARNASRRLLGLPPVDYLG